MTSLVYLNEISDSMKERAMNLLMKDPYIAKEMSIIRLMREDNLSYEEAVSKAETETRAVRNPERCPICGELLELQEMFTTSNGNKTVRSWWFCPSTKCTVEVELWHKISGAVVSYS